MKLIPICLFALFVIACKHKPGQPSPAAQAADSTQARDTPTTFLPIRGLIEQDIQRVDSYASGILRKATVNGRQDSAYIKPAAFHQAASAFLLPELEPEVFRHSFTETSFFDESVGQIQFIYTPKDAANSLRNVVVYITPSPSGDQVSRFYFEREYRSGDTAIQQKLTWKTRQYCYVITLRQPASGSPSTQVEKLIWDPEQFGQ